MAKQRCEKSPNPADVLFYAWKDKSLELLQTLMEEEDKARAQRIVNACELEFMENAYQNVFRRGYEGDAAALEWLKKRRMIRF